jgi:hypothetical protein
MAKPMVPEDEYAQPLDLLRRSQEAPTDLLAHLGSGGPGPKLLHAFPFGALAGLGQLLALQPEPFSALIAAAQLHDVGAQLAQETPAFRALGLGNLARGRIWPFLAYFGRSFGCAPREPIRLIAEG